MCNYLKVFFKDDNYREYYVIDPVENSIKRSEAKIGHPIPGNRKMHLISVNNKGIFCTRQYLNDD